MDITLGEFDDFRSTTSARSRRSDTRSSMRSETSCSLEILPPEENSEQLFMSEELISDDESDILPRQLQIIPRNIDSPKSSWTSSRLDDVSSRNSDSQSPRISRESTPDSLKDLENSEDPELAKLIKKMKKYDRILIQKMKREKEVKLQRLLFQKQMLEELSSTTEEKSEEKLALNESKFLALMPPPGQIQEMLHRLESEEFIPIFQTQVNAEDDARQSPLSPHTPKSGEEADGAKRKNSPRKTDSASVKSSMKKKIDFIKRNIELAKDAGNYISMTDDEKARLGELLSDLDNADLDEHDPDEAFTDRLALVGEGYTPDAEEMKRLAEIDEKIQTLLPQNEFDMICGTPKLGDTKKSLEVASLGEKIFVQNHAHSNERIEAIQKRLETIDEDWKRMYEGTTPRLTNEQLQRLLDECSLPRSSVSSSLSLSTLSQSEISDSATEVESSLDGSYYDSETPHDTSRSVAEQLPRETLEQLLAEARSSLGIEPPEGSHSSGEEDDGSQRSDRECATPLFWQIDRTEFSTDYGDPNRSVEISLEDFESPISTPNFH